MLRLFIHWYYLTIATFWLFLAFAKAARYFSRKALLELAIPSYINLDSKEKRRLKHYFYGTTYLSILFGILRGRTRTYREKKAFTNLAALAHFFDDLSDAFRGHDLESNVWNNNPEDYGAVADERGLSLHLLENVYATLPEKNLSVFKGYMHRVFNVETEGRQAQDSEISFNELERITREKGGCSVLLFRSVLEEKLSVSEEGAWMEFGHFIQLCDDIFDLYFDKIEGISTIASYFSDKKDTEGMLDYFEKQIKKTHEAIRKTSFPKENRASCIRAMHYMVAITRVCLYHYLDLEKERGQLPVEDRHAIVVDMEKWKNRVRAAIALLRPV